MNDDGGHEKDATSSVIVHAVVVHRGQDEPVL